MGEEEREAGRQEIADAIRDAVASIDKRLAAPKGDPGVAAALADIHDKLAAQSKASGGGGTQTGYLVLLAAAIVLLALTVAVLLLP